MSINEVLNSLIIHPNGMIELPLETYERLVADHMSKDPETNDLFIQEGL